MAEPSFELAAGVIHAASNDDGRLVRCVGLMLERFPTLVNRYQPSQGLSLLEFAVATCDSPLLLAMMLHVNCKLGFRNEPRSPSALALAVQQGRRRPVQLLLSAITSKVAFENTDATLAVASRSFAELATRFPLEFLEMISRLELEPIPGARRLALALR